MKSWMTSRQWLVTGSLLGLIALAMVALTYMSWSGQQTAPRQRRTPLVSERLLQTAHSVAVQASTREEQRYSQQALRLADHEVDLAFADGLRQASASTPPATSQAKELYERIQKLEQSVESGEREVEKLKQGLVAAGSAARTSLQQQLNLAQAQLELDQDELEDARLDLRRSGADPLSRIRRQFERHQAAEHNAQDAAEAARSAPAGSTADVRVSRANAAEADASANNLLAQFRIWYGLHARTRQLQAARNEALAATQSLNQQHETLEEQKRQPETKTNAARNNAARSADAVSANNAGAAVAALRRQAEQQKSLASLDGRVQDTQELADVYANWIAAVGAGKRDSISSMIRSVLWILIIVLALYLVARALDRLLPQATAESTRMRTLRSVTRVALQMLGVLLVIFVVFGSPSQLSTILGLAGAGLTVALKDFIVAFIGWFVLMGRNGIRVGDWVEINGVVGEVIEISLLRTVLLETGNWTDTGHPTGRKVAFMNGYAIEGHFFNFSTSGQWLWDELEVTVPGEEDPYPIIEAVQKMVARETEANARMAEQEWQHAAGPHRVVQSASGAPAVSVRPVGSGVQVRVRYVSRASERYATRARLYQAIVGLMHQNSAQGVREPAMK